MLQATPEVRFLSTAGNPPANVAMFPFRAASEYLHKSPSLDSGLE